MCDPRADVASQTRLSCGQNSQRCFASNVLLRLHTRGVICGTGRINVMK